MSSHASQVEYLERFIRLYRGEAFRMAERAGWYPFGSHVDKPDVQLEFDGADLCGEPMWERPVKERNPHD